ncbi:MAG: alpha/beta fold hydrolase [Roseiarcus sp.]
MKTQKIEASNGAIAVHVSAGHGPAVALIHGNSSSSRAFSRQLDGPLGKRFRLIAVDLPGHGESDDAKDQNAYSLPGHARAVRAAVDALGLHEARFVGWSLGGHVALEMAPDLPRARLGHFRHAAARRPAGDEKRLPAPSGDGLCHLRTDRPRPGGGLCGRVLQAWLRRHSAVLP